MKALLSTLAIVLCLPLVSVAAPDKPTSPAAMVSLIQTTHTRQLLNLQKSGQYASRNEQRLSGKAQKEIYQRYIKSFSHPIPDIYISESFTE